MPISKTSPFIGALNTQGVGKICYFRLKSPFISETKRDRPTVAMELRTLIGSHWWRFWWPRVSLKGETRGIKFSGDLLNNSRTVRPRTTNSGRITRGGAAYFRGQQRPYHKGRSPSATQFRTSLLLMHRPFDSELRDLVTLYDEGLVLGSPTPHPKGRVSQLSILRVPFYLCVHTSLNYQIWHGNTYVGNTYVLGLVLRVSHAPTPSGRGPMLPILGLSSIYAYTLCRRTTKFELVYMWGRGVYLGVSHTYRPKRAEFQDSPIYGVLLYLIYAYTH